MEEIIQKMDEAFRLISSIAVKGDDVEIMSMAKTRLREAYSAAKKHGEEEHSGQTD